MYTYIYIYTNQRSCFIDRDINSSQVIEFGAGSPWDPSIQFMPLVLFWVMSPTEKNINLQEVKSPIFVHQIPFSSDLPASGIGTWISMRGAWA